MSDYLLFVKQTGVIVSCSSLRDLYHQFMSIARFELHSGNSYYISAKVSINGILSYFWTYCPLVDPRDFDDFLFDDDVTLYCSNTYIFDSHIVY